jgi:hypothetical protein
MDSELLARWSADHLCAVRFARREDAERVMCGDEVRICEHGWDTEAAAVSAASPMIILRQWNLIAEAPMDGTPLILRRGTRVTAGNWRNDPGDEDRDGWAGWMSEDGGFTDEAPPTHFMYLPCPPDDEI